ncbi:MAG: hypothetical protein M1838_004386 [Thelocarpon superellum]|nr:MAG: hypothetical protein M1838_004386 [Thelocarpon superellum]
MPHHIDYTQSVPRPPRSLDPPRLLIIGAGSRGNAYARAITHSSNGEVVAVAEPVKFKRQQLGRKYIWGEKTPAEGQEFPDWKSFLTWEQARRARVATGDEAPTGVDGFLVCTLDESHAEIITALAPLGLHLLSEKPLATTLEDCLSIYASLLPKGPFTGPPCLFAMGHVLRYSPHNMLLRKLLLDDGVIGEVISMEHTEPVGWWHFAHSYVRGNWRREDATAPSLLTKSCHDIDLLLWLLCSPPLAADSPHLPSFIISTGSLKHFRRSQKPEAAGRATNCLSCPAEPECPYSARKIYQSRLRDGDIGFPIKIVVPEVEAIVVEDGVSAAETLLMERLAEDYGHEPAGLNRRPYYGRCVYEAGNDVCDDQVVTITWEDDATEGVQGRRHARTGKTATFHMIAFTEQVCQRRSRIYGAKGEMEADSTTIKVHDFATGQTTTHHPHQAGGGHGGGDDGLARQFVLAIDAVKNQGMSVVEAQQTHIRCTLDDVIRSHAVVFAAEEARKGRKVVDWPEWWRTKVDAHLPR